MSTPWLLQSACQSYGPLSLRHLGLEKLGELALSGDLAQCREPAVAAILFARPHKIVIWHSSEDNSRNAAPAIRDAIELLARKIDLGWTPVFEKEPRLISSSNYVEAERTLRAWFASVSNNAGRTIFNITNGNFIMRLAATDTARLESDVWLVYRDLDNNAYDFTCFRHDGNCPETVCLTGNTERLKITWSALVRPPSTWPVEPAEALVDRVLAPEKPGG